MFERKIGTMQVKSSLADVSNVIAMFEILTRSRVSDEFDLKSDTDEAADSQGTKQHAAFAHHNEM